MKYKRMLCWVDRQEKIKIQQENNKYNINIFFSRNYDEFKREINESSFLVFSLRKAKFTKTLLLIRSFPSFKFHAFSRLDDAFTTFKELQILDEKNVKNKKGCSQYREKELFKEFCIII
ncbi:hypothetical protein R84B8_00055 [Treponema sp. R8-4-B8]